MEIIAVGSRKGSSVYYWMLLEWLYACSIACNKLVGVASICQKVGRPWPLRPLRFLRHCICRRHCPQKTGIFRDLQSKRVMNGINCQNQRKTDVSVLILASHDPWVRQRQIMIFMHHTYTPTEATQLISFCIMTKLYNNIGKGRRVINIIMARLEHATSCTQCTWGMCSREL